MRRFLLFVCNLLNTDYQQHISFQPQQHIRIYKRIISWQSQPFLQPQSFPPPQQQQSINSQSMSPQPQPPPHPLNMSLSSFLIMRRFAAASAARSGPRDARLRHIHCVSFVRYAPIYFQFMEFSELCANQLGIMNSECGIIGPLTRIKLIK